MLYDRGDERRKPRIWCTYIHTNIFITKERRNTHDKLPEVKVGILIFPPLLQANFEKFYLASFSYWID